MKIINTSKCFKYTIQQKAKINQLAKLGLRKIDRQEYYLSKMSDEEK